VKFEFFDIDRHKEDDPLGDFTIDIGEVTKTATADKWFHLQNEPLQAKSGRSGKGEIHLIISNGGALTPEESFKSMIQKTPITESYMIDTFYTLGEGSFGVVYKGRSVKDGKEAAVKKLLKSAMDPQNAELLETEVRLMKRLKHPHIVELYETFEDNDAIFLCMEFVSGGELASLRSLEEHDAATYMKQILRGVKYLHSQGVVHRDLKPQNVLLGGRHGEKAKLIDFGLSKDFGKKQEKLEIAGTAEYMAPELLDGLDYDSSVDMWACGVLAYQLLTSLLPWEADPLGEPDEMKALIKAAKIDENAREWIVASDDAKDFVRKLIVIVPSSRLTANQAGGHPWILATSKSREKNSRRLQAYRKFEQMVAADE